MRPTFSDLDNIKIRAKHRIESGQIAVERWWSRKYNLPPNHELFLDRSLGELHQEMIEDLLFQKSELERRIEAGEEDQDRLVRELNEAKKALGEEEAAQDDLWEKWERELAEGKIPDLDEMPPGV
jgi:hypothetical protein